METFLEYILKSTLFLSLFILIYRGLLKKETFFKLNRFLLLSAIIISCLILPLNNSFYQTSISGIKNIYLNEVIIKAGTSTFSNFYHTDFISFIFDFYLLITAFLFIRFIIQILQILNLFLKSNTSDTGSNIIYTDKYPSFSFFNLIFINNKTSNDYEKILQHEKIHVNQFHTFDIILTELICIIHWFNPILLLYKTSFREIHEYLADEGVIKNGIDKKAYQLLLLSVAKGIIDYKPINNFNSIIKKRIIMMSKQKSSGSHLVKYGLVLPLICMLWFFPSIKLEKLQASNKNLITKTQQEKPKVKEQKAKNEEVFTVVENQPEFIGGQTAMIEFLTKNIVYPNAEREKGIQGTVYVTFIVETDGNLSNVKVIRGVNKALDTEAVRVVNLMKKKWKAGTFKGKPVRVQFNLPIKYALEEK